MNTNKQDKKITIAIDGFSSTGKSTVAKEMAKRLGYIYVDTGAMYRAVTYYALKKGYIDTSHFDKAALISDLHQIKISFRFNSSLGFSEVYLNGENIEKNIRDIEVSSFVSPVATVSEVRRFLVEKQREMGKNKAVVMDGRDIGSVVFPDAELKFFITADPKVRAERRLLEMQEKGLVTSFEEILKNVEERDRIDSTREDSPLIKVDDAILIDASHINKEEQFELMMHHAIRRINA